MTFEKLSVVRARYRDEELRRRRRIRAQKAGRASGEKRRATARGRRGPWCRDRAQALALAYPVRQAPEAKVRELFQERVCDVEGILFSERGFQTVLAEYRAEWAAHRVKGQDFQTTNRQRAAALRSRGRPRCERTVRRTRRRLEQMGLMAYQHVKRLGARPGFRDSLRVRVLSFVRLPLAARTGKPSASCSVLASTQIAPPGGGRERPPDKPAGNSGYQQSAQQELEFFDVAAARRSSDQRPSIWERYGVPEL